MEVDDDNLGLQPDTFGRISSYYYLEHKTMRLFGSEIDDDMDIPSVLKVRRCVAEGLALHVEDCSRVSPG